MRAHLPSFIQPTGSSFISFLLVAVLVVVHVIVVVGVAVVVITALVVVMQTLPSSP
jgi:hypothetical protein